MTAPPMLPGPPPPGAPAPHMNPAFFNQGPGPQGPPQIGPPPAYGGPPGPRVRVQRYFQFIFSSKFL